MDPRGKPSPSGGVAIPIEPSDPNLPPKVRDVLHKGKSSWLKNPEVCELLVNHAAFNLPISRDAPMQPPGGSIFLFDRKAVRFFRKDGHNWRKKADGKTVRETHEKLKVGNQDMLNCYYAHANQEDGLQRRCYWLLTSEDDIVLVHYLNIEKDKSGMRKNDNPNEFERTRSRVSNFSQTSSGNFGPGMMGLISSLTGGVQGRDGGAFLPLGAGMQSLQPTGLDHFFEYCNQTEENLVRRDLQQNATFAENLLPGAWDNISNGSGPALDPGLPDWAHAGLMRDDHLGDQATLVEHAGSLRLIEAGLGVGDDGWPDMANAMRTPSLEMRMRSQTNDLRASLRGRQNSIERAAVMGLPHSNLFSGVRDNRSLGIGGVNYGGQNMFNMQLGANQRTLSGQGYGGASYRPLGSSQIQKPDAAITNTMIGNAMQNFQRNQQSFDLGQHASCAQRQFGMGMNGGGISLPPPSNSLQAFQQENQNHLRAQLDMQLAQARGHRNLMQQEHAQMNAAAELNAVYRQQHEARLGRYSEDLSMCRTSTGTLPGTRSEHMADMHPGIQAQLISAQQALTPQPTLANAAAGMFPRALSEGHYPIQMMAESAAAPPLPPAVQVTNSESHPPPPMWRGNATSSYKTGQVLAMAGQLNDIDRQVMDSLVNTGNPGMAAAGPAPNMIDTKILQVKTLEEKLERLEAGSQMLLSSGMYAQAGDSGVQSGAQTMSTAMKTVSGDGEVNQMSPGGSSESHRDNSHPTSSRPMNMGGIEVVDFTPDWDFTVGGAKMIITFRTPRDEGLDRTVYVMFDQEQVPACILCHGALRCHVPPHEAGTVKLWVATADGLPLCKPQPFTYRLTPDVPRVADAMAMVSPPDRELQLRMINMLLGVPAAPAESGGSEGFSTPMSSGDASRIRGRPGASSSPTGDDPVIVDGQGNLAALDVNQLEKLLTLLLERKIKQVASLPSKGKAAGPLSLQEVVSRLSPGGVGLIHFTAALGYDWAVNILLQSGTKLSLKDAWGLTALHWAAMRGHERTVALLLLRKADASLLSFPTAKRPGRTAADLASQNGHAGIAAYVAEVFVMQDLAKQDQGAVPDTLSGATTGPDDDSASETSRPGSSHMRKRSRQLPVMEGGSELDWDPSRGIAVAGVDLPTPNNLGNGTIGDAAKVVGRVRWAVNFIQQSMGRQQTRKVRLDERRQRLAQREGEALSRIGESIKLWSNVRSITQDKVDGPDSLINRFMTLGDRITRLNQTIKGALLHSDVGKSGSDTEEVEEGWRAERDRGEIADYSSDSDVHMIRSESLASARRLQQLHDSRRKNSLTGIKGMGVNDSEVRAFLRGSGPSSAANPPELSDKELREQLRRDSAMSTRTRSPTVPMSSPPPSGRSSRNLSNDPPLALELQTVLTYVEALLTHPAAMQQYMRVHQHVQQLKSRPASPRNKCARTSSSAISTTSRD